MRNFDLPPAEPVPPELVRQIAMESVPHHKAIGTQLVKYEPGDITLSLGWREDLVEDPETGALAGATVAALLDHAAGLAVATSVGMPALGASATLDLRVDFLKPPTRGQTVVARCECYAMRDGVAFARGEAWHPGEPPETLATAAVTYVMGASVPLPGKANT